MTKRFNLAVASLLFALMLAGMPATATFTNQQSNGDQNTHYITVGAASLTMACASGFIQTSTATALFSCTSDGATWKDGSFKGLGTSLTFVDASKGYLGTATGATFASADGGASWQKIADANIGNLVSVIDIATTPDGKTVFILGTTGDFAYSADGGATWTKGTAEIPAGNTSASAAAVVGQNVWVVGGDFGKAPQGGTGGRPPGNGFVKVSTDGGVTFTTLGVEMPYCIYDVSFVSAKEGWIAGGGATQGSAVIGYTTDGGDTFTTVTPPALPDSERLTPNVFKGDLGSCTRIRFFGPKVGLALCSSGTLEESGFNGLYMTKDGGRTWELQPGYRDGFGANKDNLFFVTAKANDMSMPDCKGGFIVGDGKLIQRWDADDKSIDCATGEGDGDGEVPAGDDGGNGGGRQDSCGCETPGLDLGRGSLLGVILGWLS
ncbi:MAG: sialidase family protein [Deltaproteobacteria bacterium]|nr:sialidase family protein [Deltaproteobacteria bacterium]